MTYEEYSEMCGKLTKENAPQIMKDVLDNIKTDLAELGTAKTSIAELEKKNRDLQDTNIKLFLSQTSKRDDDNGNEEDENELTGDAALDFYSDKIRVAHEPKKKEV